LPLSEAITLKELQDIIPEQLIIDYGYHDEIFHSYKVKKNHLVGLWLPDLKSTKVPESVGNLKFLKSLDLSGWEISSLPESIGNLTSLKSLNLSDCNLVSLPESFLKLQNLEELYIRGNLFESTPKLISKLKSLNYLDVYDIDLIDIPPFR
jgi:Leucine-rich repeat (LRR) protein